MSVVVALWYTSSFVKIAVRNQRIPDFASLDSIRFINWQFIRVQIHDQVRLRFKLRCLEDELVKHLGCGQKGHDRGVCFNKVLDLLK